MSEGATTAHGTSARPVAPEYPPPPLALHLAAGLFVAAAAIVSALRLFWFGVLMGEDALLEWLTVTLYVAAAVPMLVRAVRFRRPFDLLVALFCVFVAGEEMSWGQRLLGITPPTMFLEHNEQQELTLHNFGATRSIFLIVMLGFGLLMPLVARTRVGRALMDRIGATPPPLALLPWYVASVVLVKWDPTRLGGEFGETLAAALFLVTQRPPPSAVAARRGWRPWAGATAAAALLTLVSHEQGVRAAARLGCARLEAEAIAADLGSGALLPYAPATPAGFVRLWLMSRRGFVIDSLLTRYRAAACTDAEDNDRQENAAVAERRRFGLDPWEMSYFVGVRQRPDGTRTVEVMSFGPNRQREGTYVEGVGDDVRASAPTR